MVGRRCIVKGQVQGVWFRDTARRKAEELGVHGSAINLPDGSVEVLACGEEAAVAALCEWLWEGSPQSQVSNVECEYVQAIEVGGFRIG